MQINRLFAILEGIQPAKLRRKKTALSLAYRSLMDFKHLLRQLIVGPTTTHEERLRSRHPFASAVCKLLNELSQLSIHAATMIINGT